MDKFMFMPCLDNLMFIIYLFILLILTTLIANSPELPVYYLMYMLLFLVLLLGLFSMSLKSDLYYFIFLIISGGIMVTFLFFMVFNNTECYNMESMIFYLIICLMIVFNLIIYFLLGNKKLININSSLDNISNCYIESYGMFMTLFCMTYLLLILYLMVKISTSLKSSPMREQKS